MLSFTPATDAEIPVLRELANRIWRAHYPAIIGTAQVDYMLARIFAPEALQRDMASGVQWELVWHDDSPAGFLACIYEPAALKLSKLYLLTELHGRGLGQQMLERVKAKAGERGLRQVYLTVNKQNAKAIRAYQKAGFRVERAVVADIGGGFVMDDFVMVWEPA